MAYIFTKDDYNRISGLLGSEPDVFEQCRTWNLSNPATRLNLVFSIYNNVDMAGTPGTILSVQSHHGYYELHNCTGYIIFPPDEVIFLNSTDDSVSCLTVGKQCSCSVFSNIKKEILSRDITTLEPALLLAAMQTSITGSFQE